MGKNSRWGSTYLLIYDRSYSNVFGLEPNYPLVICVNWIPFSLCWILTIGAARWISRKDGRSSSPTLSSRLPIKNHWYTYILDHSRPRPLSHLVSLITSGDTPSNLLGADNHVTVNVDTLYPFSDTLHTTITATKAFTYFVRIPSWVSGGTIAINGGKANAVNPSNGLQAVSVSPGTTTFVLNLPAKITIGTLGGLCLNVSSNDLCREPSSWFHRYSSGTIQFRFR